MLKKKIKRSEKKRCQKTINDPMYKVQYQANIYYLEIPILVVINTNIQNIQLPLWDLLGSGIKPMSPVLSSGFLTTGPPGKSNNFFWDKLKF